MERSEDKINRGVGQAKAAVAQANEHFNSLKGDAVRAAQSAAEIGRSGVEAAKTRLHDGQDYLHGKLHEGQDYVNSKLHDGQDYVSDVADRVRSRGSDLLTSVQDQIEHNPLQAIAIAAGVGVVLGVLLRRR